MEKIKKTTVINIFLIVLVVLIAAVALFINSGIEFSGADGQAEAVIQQINPTYTPWAANIWEPPGGEIESMLFALQAAAGAGVIFYILGFLKGKAKGRKEQ